MPAGARSYEALRLIAILAILSCLASDARLVVDKSFELLKRDPRHPSLCLKKVLNGWSVRIGDHYRAIAADDPRGLLWVWIGHHHVYDKLLRR